MNILLNTAGLILHFIVIQSAIAVPIIPLSLLFGEVSRSHTLDRDSNPSIGPGLGGSPVLVDTRNHDKLA